MALGVCLVCSLLVSAAAVSLRPRQARNKALEQKRNILAAAGLLAAGADVEALYRTRVRPRLVELDTGQYVADADVAGFDLRRAARDPATSDPLPASEDLAGIRRRPRRAPVYLVQNGGRTEQVILPVYGLGLWSTMYGFVALDAADLNTVRGLVFYEHGETPGLGGEVDNPNWRALWPGKKVYGADGAVRLALVKGGVDPARSGSEHQVDGLSGATLTSRGVERMIHFWLGKAGFGKYLRRVAEAGV